MRHKTRERLISATHAIAERLAWALDRSRRDRSARAEIRLRQLAELIRNLATKQSRLKCESRWCPAPLVVQLPDLDEDEVRGSIAEHRKASRKGMKRPAD